MANFGSRRSTTVSSESEQLSEREAFENGYYYFIQALEILSLPASEQCERMGNYNTAWELKHDVDAAAYLMRSPSSGRLSEIQRRAVSELLAALADIPVNQLPAGPKLEANLTAMNHASWGPLRPRAAELLRLLAPATEECMRYLYPDKPAAG